MIERRQKQPGFNGHRHLLSHAQEVSARDLFNFGYDLKFVRQSGDEKIAILMLDDNIAVIDEHGDICPSEKYLIR